MDLGDVLGQQVASAAAAAAAASAAAAAATAAAEEDAATTAAAAAAEPKLSRTLPISPDFEALERDYQALDTAWGFLAARRMRRTVEAVTAATGLGIERLRVMCTGAFCTRRAVHVRGGRFGPPEKKADRTTIARRVHLLPAHPLPLFSHYFSIVAPDVIRLEYQRFISESADDPYAMASMTLPEQRVGGCCCLYFQLRP